MLQAIIRHYALEAGIQDARITTPGTITILRKKGKELYNIFINMDGSGGQYYADNGCTDAFTGKAIPAGWNQLGKYEYVITKK